MRKQSYFKKAISLAVAAAMTLAVCTTALADDTATAAQNESTQTEESAEPEATPAPTETPQTQDSTEGEEQNRAVVLNVANGEDTIQPNDKGQYEVSNSDQMLAVLESLPDSTTDVTFVLGKGNFTLYNFYGKDKDPAKKYTAGRNLTFIGQGRSETSWQIGAVVPDPANYGTEYNGDYSFDGANTVTFQNMTLMSGAKDYLGFIRPNNTVVENCELTGKSFYWGYASATFKDSTFTCPDGDYTMWVYSSPVANFENCVFNASGKVLNVYREGADGTTNVINIKDCTVNSSATNKAFVNINDSTGQHYKINITNTKVNGLAASEVTGTNVFGFSSAVNNAGNTEITVDGVLVWKDGVKQADIPTPTPIPTATPEPTAEPTPTPAPTAAPTATPAPTPAPTAAPVEVKTADPVVNDSALTDVTPAEKEKLVEAAESATISESKELANNETVQNVAKSADEYIAADGTVKDTLKEDILKAADAPEELKKAAEADVSDITLVSAPYLQVTPQESADDTLVFDIKLYCALKATTDPDNMTAANTCTLKTEKVENAPVMNITLDVSKAYSGDKLNTLYVKHVTESGAVYYYKAYSKGNGIIEFTNPHGFSTFTVLSDTRVATVKLAGKEYTFHLNDVGGEFPHPDMPGYTYKGYQFDDISGSYTTLTEELFNKLAAAGKTVSATATFSAIATPAPAATAAPEATAAPTATPAPTLDDSQYYTCKDCGHHNWTATAEGYKCDTCGRIETKQLSDYKNVKGTYTPTASSAAAKTTSAIPQTSDSMPIVPIAIVMIAALLGLGVTLYMKKKQN